MNWIKTSEELPAPGEVWHLAWHADDDMARLLMFTGDGWCEYEGGAMYDNAEISHWAQIVGPEGEGLPNE